MTDADVNGGHEHRRTNGSEELRTEDEALSVLMDADIDKVMSGLDKIIEAAPSYQKLFMRWQRQHWSTEDFDFTEDAKQWADSNLITPEEKQFLLFGFSQFFLGEERVTVELLPFALGAPSHEAQAFLTTQISDEAKHMVFFDRFYREVLGSSAATIKDNLD
ncbi:MAG TPA: ribonucleotide-diphosphate reductase subunit beta, partial [Solirubrobacterales bacterium]|nr:ribonucleotide-diphosphate reductase subunit beta [Solirubrobacterales bacterium]